MNTKTFIYLLLAGLLSSNLLFSQNYREKRNYSTKDKLINRIDNLEKDFSSRISHRDRIEFQKQIDEIIDLIKQLPDEDATLMPNPEPMTDPEFAELIKTINNSSFQDDKKQIIRSSSNHNFFTVAQVIEIATIYPFDDDRLDVIKTLYPRILDVHKNYLLYNCFKFDSEKEKLERFINDYETKRANQHNTRSITDPGYRTPPITK
jgi:hypothetical protein